MTFKLFKNSDEFFKLNGLNNESYSTKYEAIVRALDYGACKEILLRYITYDELLKAYKKDEHLNNILNNKVCCKDVLPNFSRFSNDTCWAWDIIGYQMLHNNKATIRLKLISLSTLTSIAKACAILILKDEKEAEDV